MKVTFFIDRYSLKPFKEKQSATVYGCGYDGVELPVIRLWGDSAQAFDQQVTAMIEVGKEVSDSNIVIEFNGQVLEGKPFEKDGKTIAIPYFKIEADSLFVLQGAELALAQKRKQAYTLQTQVSKALETNDVEYALTMVSGFIKEFSGKSFDIPQINYLLSNKVSNPTPPLRAFGEDIVVSVKTISKDAESAPIADKAQSFDETPVTSKAALTQESEIAGEVVEQTPKLSRRDRLLAASLAQESRDTPEEDEEIEMGFGGYR